jgi:hypothetical protein
MPNRITAGGPIEGRVATFVPISTWTDAAIGDLVKITTGANYEVTECANSDVPAGIVASVNLQKDVLGVELFTSGAISRLPYTGTPALGNQIQASAATTVKGVASAGTGKVIAVDAVSGYVDVLFV